VAWGGNTHGKILAKTRPQISEADPFEELTFDVDMSVAKL